jgi:hypothetical protein
MKEKQPPTNDEVVEAEAFGQTMSSIMSVLNYEAWRGICASPALGAAFWRGMFNQNCHSLTPMRPSNGNPNEGPFPTKS